MYVEPSMTSTISTDTDVLTGLPGRAAFESDFAARIGRKVKQAAVISLAVVDIDLFGAINEAHGRETGDGVLCDLVASLTAHLSGEDALYRFGGDALAVMMPGVEKEQAFLRMEAFRSGYAGERKLSTGRVVLVSISMGLAAYADDGAKAQDVMLKANEALYRAKVGGRDRICLAREEKMVTKTSHYMQGQLLGLRRLAEREKIGEALLLREALNDLLRKYNA